MDILLILQMILAALLAVLIYTFIGFIPGTDETSVLMPITLAIVLSGAQPIIILTFFYCGNSNFKSNKCYTYGISWVTWRGGYV